MSCFALPLRWQFFCVAALPGEFGRSRRSERISSVLRPSLRGVTSQQRPEHCTKDGLSSVNNKGGRRFFVEGEEQEAEKNRTKWGDTWGRRWLQERLNGFLGNDTTYGVALEAKVMLHPRVQWLQIRCRCGCGCVSE